MFKINITIYIKMAFTRFNYDEARTNKRLEENIGVSLYQFNVPGNGPAPYYYEDPQIRLTKWGGNLHNNSVDIESDFRGLTRPLSKDCHTYGTYKVNGQERKCPKYTDTTRQSRVTHPVWWYRDMEQTKNDILPLDPQENVCYPFEVNVNTQLLEKDEYQPPTFNKSLGK
jgi:hypothetical protein